MSKRSMIQASRVFKHFDIGEQKVEVLKNVDTTIEEGEFCVIFGPSGCGKSTLLYIMLGLEEPSQGTITVAGSDIFSDTTMDDRAVFRKKHIGMVYQQANWITSLTVIENVAFPLMLLGNTQRSAKHAAYTQLERVGMEEWASYIPTELSGGQQQRVALARALVHDPDLIVADEPTGNLDFESGKEVMQILKSLNENEKKTIVMVTHDLEYLKYASSAIQMLDGQIQERFNDRQHDQLLEHVISKRHQSLIQTSPSVDKPQGTVETI